MVPRALLFPAVLALVLAVAWVAWVAGKSRVVLDPDARFRSFAEHLPSTSDVPARPVVVRGTLRNSHALAGTTIRVRESRWPPDPDDAGLEASLDAQGRYECALASPGSYTFVVEAPGCATWSRAVEVPEQSEFGFDLELGRIPIQGRVVGPDGEPVPGVEISTHEIGSVEGRDGSTFGTALSGADGRFGMAGFVVGEYEIWATADRAEGSASIDFVHGVETGIRLEAGEVPAPLEIRLARGATIRVRVLAPDGRPAEGAVVEVASDSLFAERFASAVDGVATARGVHPGRCRLHAQRGQEVAREIVELDSRAGEEHEAVLQLVPGGGLRVQVEYRDGTGVAYPFEVPVGLDDWNGHAVGWDSFDAPTDRHHERAALLPGLYTLRARFPAREEEVVQRVQVEVGTSRVVVLREPQ